MKYLTLVFLFALAGCDSKPPAYDVFSGLVVNIPFDGYAQDYVSGTNGTVYAATYAVDHHGNAGKAMYFNSADSAIVDFGALPLASFTNNQFTISCWVKVADTTAPIAVLSKRGNTGPWEYAIDNQFNHNVFILDNWTPNGSTSVYGTDPMNATVTIQPGQWMHLAYVADGSIMKVYVNGVLQAGTDMHNSNCNLGATTAHLLIGNGGGYGRNYYFNGCVDDIKMYNRALPASSIQYLASQ